MEYFEYRTSLIFYVISTFTWSLASLLVQKSIFNQIGTLKGWTFGEFALLNAVYNYAFSFYIMFTWTSIWSDFRNAVRHGTLDQILTKPFAHRLHLTFGHFDITDLLHLIPSTIILIVALSAQSFSFSFLHIILCIVFIGLGQYMLNSIAFLMYSITFWVTSAQHISQAFWSVEGQGKTPLEILPKWARIFFLSVIPIGFVAYIHTKILLGEFHYSLLLFSISLVIAMWWVTKLVWNAGLKRYESVSS